jgi:hypothetical protein
MNESEGRETVGKFGKVGGVFIFPQPFKGVCLSPFACRNTIPTNNFSKTWNMEFVSEKIIDAVIEELENLPDEQYEQRMEAFAEAQPVLVAWLFSDNFDLLNDDEKGYLQYLALIAWLSIVKVNGIGEPVSEEQIGLAEEKNYELLEGSTAKKFRDRLDVFFENTPQEDLLAFAEEAVLEDENDPEALVTKEGREPIFVALKTLVDVLGGV